MTRIHASIFSAAVLLLRIFWKVCGNGQWPLSDSSFSDHGPFLKSQTYAFGSEFLTIVILSYKKHTLNFVFCFQCLFRMLTVLHFLFFFFTLLYSCTCSILDCLCRRTRNWWLNRLHCNCVHRPKKRNETKSSYSKGDSSPSLLPPPIHFGKHFRETVIDFQLPYDIWWLYKHDSVSPQKFAGEHWINFLLKITM